MHGRGMFHRDLKPQNILVDTTQEDEPSLKIADFGLGRTHALPVPQLTHEIGSLYYRAPEVLLGTEYYSHAVDMWSVGCIFAEFFLRVRVHCIDAARIVNTTSIEGTVLWNWRVPSTGEDI